MTYIQTAFFSVFLVVVGLRRVVRALWRGRSGRSLNGKAREGSAEGEAFLGDEGAVAVVVEEDDGVRSSVSSPSTPLPQGDGTGVSREEKLTTRETVKLALEFCLLWFFANVTLSIGLEYTSVGSSTVLTATSSMWTLLFGAIFKVERFTLVKLFGVIVSLAGIVLISMIDLSGDTDKNRGNFPHKAQAQIALGDVLSLISAILYASYAIFIKKRIGDENKIDMLLFFGFVGLINTFILWPGIILLHFVGLEPFELPPTPSITYIILVSRTSSLPFSSTDQCKINSVVSIFADLCWGYAVVLTSPLVVTVGLSMSIPLALFGQMIINGSSSSVAYWIGALLVFAAFGLINHESKQSEEIPAASNTQET